MAARWESGALNEILKTISPHDWCTTTWLEKSQTVTRLGK